MEHKYNWKDYPEINSLLNEIYKNTLLENRQNGNLPQAIELVRYIEDYILNVINQYDAKKTIASLEKIKSIRITKSTVPIYILGSTIVINENLFKNNSKEENTTTIDSQIIYYLYYELSKHIISFKSEITEKFSKIYSNSLQGYDKKIETQIMVNNGWLFLEEIIAKEAAERFTYITLNKIRLSTKIDFKYYNIIVMFGMTLNKIGNKENHSNGIIMYSLLKKAFNNDFSKEVISEYISRNSEFELYQILYIMGLIINEQNNRIPNVKLTDEEINNLFIELNKLLTGSITLEEDEYQTVETIEEKRLNPFEKIRILRLIKDKRI